MKKNIQPTKIGLDFINNLKPVIFEYRQNNEKNIGFIAQDLIKLQVDMNIIIPSLVLNSEKGLLVSTNQLIPVLVNSVQELTEKNKELLNRIENLTKCIDNLTKCIDNLTNRIEKLEG
jgi:peptidoglycan hydrolase CwlO-like protein